MRIAKIVAPIVGVLLFAVPAFAQTTDLATQIATLLAQIQALQAQLSSLTSSTATTISTSSNSCPDLYRALSRGSRGSDVTSLQRFLIAQGLLNSDSATGFFGSMTEGAVQRWQAQNSIVSYGDAMSTGYGVVGARTRAAFFARCGTKPPVVQSCPQIIPPQCTNGTLVSNGTDANGCSLGYGRVTNPASASPPPSITAVPPPVVSTPSISVSGPTAGQNIKRGETVRISWKSQNEPTGSVVTLWAESDTGDINAAVTGASWQQPTSGYFDWTVSNANGACSLVSPSPCLSDGRTYKIKATLLKPGSSGNTTCTGSVCSTTPGTSAEVYSTAYSNSFTIGQQVSACNYSLSIDVQKSQLYAIDACVAAGGNASSCDPCNYIQWIAAHSRGV